MLYVILSVQTKNSSCAVPENPLLSTPWRAPAYEHKTFRLPFFNASELALPIAGRADEEICVSPPLFLDGLWKSWLKILITALQSFRSQPLTVDSLLFMPAASDCSWCLVCMSLSLAHKAWWIGRGTSVLRTWEMLLFQNQRTCAWHRHEWEKKVIIQCWRCLFAATVYRGEMMHDGDCKYLACLFRVWLLAGNHAENHWWGAGHELRLARAQQL